MTIGRENIFNQKSPPNKVAIVERYQYLVISIANQVNNKMMRTLPLEDLIQSGMVGLLESAERFDPTRKVDFATFSYYRIKGAIYDSLRDMGFLPATERKARIDASLNEISLMSNDSSRNVLGNCKTEIEELENTVSDLLTSYFLTVSLEEAPEIRIDSDQVESVEKKEIFAVLAKAVAELPTMERELITGVFYKQIPAIQICRRLNISKSWGSKLQASGIARLKKRLIQAGIFY